MSKKTFTPEQKRELLANQYTKLVGSHYIRFTDAFWQEFGRRILAGEDRYAICRSMGYDPDIIGTKRLEYICRTIRNAQTTTARKTRKPPGDTKYSEMSQDEAIRAMETELTYLRQEVEFLKKISQLGKEDKR